MKPMERLNHYLNTAKRLNHKPLESDKVFEPCTSIDTEVMIAMKDPVYQLKHAAAVLNYNK